ncbi:MAG: transcriptional coactivator p15/PC4 family protein [Spirochaetes bacterium]|nr:transcriptional coactivator p15/PC4 family protein [Spirochaetota bacterium]
MGAIIKDIEKNSKEIIRIDISEFKGQELINLRIWFQAFDGNGNMIYKPTQKGIAINISKYDELKEGIEKIGEYIHDKKTGFKPEDV